jgi:RNA polymerase sigma-70 factor (ECF subfamily)
MDKNEFGRLVIESRQTLYRVSKSFLRNDSDCEDAASAAVMIAFCKLHTLKNDQYAKTWLVRILINECCKILRFHKRVVSVNENIMPSGQDRSYSELYDALMTLSDKLRIVTVLYYIEGFSTAEISGILKISQGTVKSRLSRSRHSLKEILGWTEESQ